MYVKIQVPPRTKNPCSKWLLCFCMKWSPLNEVVFVRNCLCMKWPSIDDCYQGKRITETEIISLFVNDFHRFPSFISCNCSPILSNQSCYCSWFMVLIWSKNNLQRYVVINSKWCIVSDLKWIFLCDHCRTPFVVSSATDSPVDEWFGSVLWFLTITLIITTYSPN